MQVHGSSSSCYHGVKDLYDTQCTDGRTSTTNKPQIAIHSIRMLASAIASADCVASISTQLGMRWQPCSERDLTAKPQPTYSLSSSSSSSSEPSVYLLQLGSAASFVPLFASGASWLVPPAADGAAAALVWGFGGVLPAAAGVQLIVVGHLRSGCRLPCCAC